MASTWQEYFEEYPAQVTDIEPVDPLYRTADRVDAERFLDNFQETHEVGGVAVIQYGDEFFVVYKD